MTASYLRLAAAAVLLTSLLSACTRENSSPQAHAATAPALPPADTIRSIRIAAVGDLMCHSPQFTNVKVGVDSFDFRPCYAEIAPAFRNADFTIGNLETVLGSAAIGYKGYPNFNSPDDYLDPLIENGFDFLVTANNHSLDQGEKGIMRTLDVLDNYKIPHTGTHRSKEDRDSIRIVDIKGIRIAIVNFTYGMNGYKCPEGKPWMVNEIDSALIKNDIAAAKALRPDLVLAFFHWGNEYEHEPNAYQKANAQYAIDAGVDLILGAHPHVVQPVEKFKTKGGNLDSGLVAWSLGNFFSNQQQRYTDAGLVLHFDLHQDLRTKKITLGDIGYVPTWVYRAYDTRKKMHVILPAEYALKDTLPYAYVNAEYKKKMKQAFEDTEIYINKYRPLTRIPMATWAN